MRAGDPPTEFKQRCAQLKIAGVSIAYPALNNLFAIIKEFSGFGIGSQMAFAERGFAFETKNGLRFYGVLSPKGNVVFLCLANTDGFADKCGDTSKTFHLAGVDWCKCQTIRN